MGSNVTQGSTMSRRGFMKFAAGSFAAAALAGMVGCSPKTISAEGTSSKVRRL